MTLPLKSELNNTGSGEIVMSHKKQNSLASLISRREKSAINRTKRPGRKENLNSDLEGFMSSFHR